MPSEEECRVMAKQWALPSADAVCTSRPRPFSIQSSEQPDQFTVEWTQSQRLTHTHIHTFFMYNGNALQQAATQARIGIYSCMLKNSKTEVESKGWYIIQGNSLLVKLKFTNPHLLTSLHATLKHRGADVLATLLHPNSCNIVLTHQICTGWGAVIYPDGCW